MFAAKNTTKTASPSSITNGEKSSFIQPKLKVGKPGDKYEVEADKAADQIVAKSNDTATPFFQATPSIQKQSDEEVQKQEAQETEIQQQPVVDSISSGVQLKEEETLQKKEEEEVQQKEETIEEVQKATDDESVQQVSSEDTLQPKEITDTTSTPPLVQKNAQEDLQQKEEEEIQEKEDEEVQTLQKQAASDTPESSSSSIETNLQSSKGGGSPMDKETKTEMESGFGADFSSVRIHNDSNAVQMNQQLGAQAFTNGSDIYFNEGKYNPSSNTGKHLLAHELTHTVQQGAASIQRKPLDISSVPEMIQGFGFLDLVPDWIINDARRIPGYTLFTVVITYDPLTGRNVDRNAINLVQGLLELIPIAGPAIFDKLQEYGILERAFNWISGKLSELGLSSDALLDLVEEAWDELEFPYTNAISVITSKFTTLLNRVTRFASSLFEQLMTWVKEALIDVAEPYLEENQAWSLLKKVIHYDPLRGEEVQAETVEILEDFLILIGKETELEQMRERGTLQETADWLDTQIGAFMTLLGQLQNLIDSAWDAIQPENLPNILDSISSLATQAGEFLQGLWDFASTVAIEVLKLIKDSLLSWLNTFAADIPGFTLLTVIIRINPLTGETVERSIQNIIRGFMGLVPGGEAKYQELRESGVIPRAAGQIEALIAQLGISAASIVQLFTDLWNSFTIDDLLDPIAAFGRITAQFGEPISRLFSFVVKVVKVLIELLLEIMGIPPDMIGNIIANAMSAFEDIKNDPVGFLMNLLDALKNGFLQFLNNIGTHLLNGIQNWLFGTLADAGVEIPSDLSIRSLLGMAMDVLGITLDNILERLALQIGPERVEQIRSVLDTLTGVWAFVRDVIERGPIAIWEYIQDQISNLWNVIKEGIMGFIQEKVIQQAIGWLLSFLDVTGIMPVIRGVQTAFNAITSFIEKLREILEIVNSFVAGIADIARGSIQSAANFLERALADGIPVAISFLAKQLGLGDISEKIAEMIENTRAMINEGIDWLIERALAAGTAFLNALGLGGSDEEAPEEESDGSLELSSVESTFRDENNEDHRLYITIQGNNATIMMASNNPDDLHNKIEHEQVNDTNDTPEQEAQLSQADQLRGQLVTFIQNHLTNSGDAGIEGIQAEIQTKLNEIRDAVVAGGIDSDLELPPTEVTHGLQGGKPHTVIAQPLTSISGNTTGSAPSEDPVGWDLVEIFKYIQVYVDDDGKHKRMNEGNADHVRKMNYRIIVRPDDWVRFHLLNEVAMHGPGVSWNLVASSGTDNNPRYLNQIENPVKNKIQEEGTGPLYFEVVVSEYRGEIPFTDVQQEDQEFVDEIKNTYGESYRKLPAKLTVNAGKLIKENGSSSYTRDPNDKIHDNEEFVFNDGIDVTVDPGTRVQVLMEQGGVNNGHLGISNSNSAFLRSHRGAVSSVSALVDKLFTADTTRSLSIGIQYLTEIKSALERSTDTQIINLFNGSDNDAVIGDIDTKIEAINTIISSKPSKSELRTKLDSSNLAIRGFYDTVYMTKVGNITKVQGIDFKIRSLGFSTFSKYFGGESPVGSGQEQNWHIISKLLN